MPEPQQNSLSVSHSIIDNTLMVNFKFPQNLIFKSEKSFKKYLDFEPVISKRSKIKNSLVPIYSLKKWIRCAVSKVIRPTPEIYKNLVSYRKDLISFCKTACNDYSKLNFHTPEYKRIRKKIKEMDKKLRVFLKHNNREKIQQLWNLLDEYEQQESKLEQNLINQFFTQKKQEFILLRETYIGICRDLLKIFKEKVPDSYENQVSFEELEKSLEFFRDINNIIDPTKVKHFAVILLNWKKKSRNLLLTSRL